MARALAFSREKLADPLERMRSAVVIACAAALIAAGQALPFIG